MRKYDKLTYIILNKILIRFGVRIKDGEKVVFVYKTLNYIENIPKYKMRVIFLNNNIESAFSFLKMNYYEYKRKEFKNIFEYVSWIMDTCPYFTKDIIKYLRSQLDEEVFETDDELKQQVLRFVRTFVLSHAVVKDFDFTPFELYPNLREAVVRKHFGNDTVTNQIVEAKLELRNDNDLIGKFSGGKVVNWIHSLRKDSTLTGMFVYAFVNHVTNDEPKNFPRYLIDNNTTIIKKEVVTFFYNVYLLSEEYRIYVIEGMDEDNIIRS